MFIGNQFKLSNVFTVCLFAVSYHFLMVAEKGIGQAITPTNLTLPKSSYNHTSSSMPMFGIDKLFRTFIFKDLVSCISSYSELEQDGCVKNLLLQVNTFKDGNSSLSQFYTKARGLIIQSCTPQCDQNYRSAMMKIVNKCVPRINQKLAANPPNGTDIVMLSQATYQIGTSLTGFIKDFVCAQNPNAPGTCTMDVIDFAEKNRLLTRPPELGNHSLFSKAGFQSIASSVNLTSIFMLGPESFCTQCNQVLGRKAEMYFANELLPTLSTALPNTTINGMIRRHVRWVTKVSSVCGPNFIPNTVRPMTSNESFYSLQVPDTAPASTKDTPKLNSNSVNSNARITSSSITTPAPVSSSVHTLQRVGMISMIAVGSYLSLILAV